MLEIMMIGFIVGILLACALAPILFVIILWNAIKKNQNKKIDE